MSVTQVSVSGKKKKASHSIEVLKGRTGNIIQVLSDRAAIVRDNIYGDITFTEDVLKFSATGNESGFRSHFPIDKRVYFDIEIDNVGNVKCIGIWVSKKQQHNFLCSESLFITPETATLSDNIKYKGTVIQMRHPYAFVVEIDVVKIPVFVFNQAFKPTRRAEKLCNDEPVCLYVSKGDTVYVTVYRNSQGKEFEWCARDAWMEGNNASEPSTSSANSLCKEKKRKRRQRRRSETKTAVIMKGKLSYVDSVKAQLDNTDDNETVFFHRNNAFLFGVPLKGLRLDHILRTGEELSFLLSEESRSEAACVWFGSSDTSSQDLRERTNSIIRYCKERGINDPSVLTTIFQELGSQRLSGDGKQEEFDDDEEGEIYDSHATTLYYSGSLAGSISSKDLNDFGGSKSDQNQEDGHETVKQTTASRSVTVTDSKQNISTTTDATKQSGSTAVVTENTIESKQTACPTSTIPSSNITGVTYKNVNITAVTAKQSGTGATTEAMTKQNPRTASEEIGCTVTTPFTAATSKTVADTLRQIGSSTKETEITTKPLKPNRKEIIDSSKDNNKTSESMKYRDKATGGKLNNRVICGQIDVSGVSHLTERHGDMYLNYKQNEADSLSFFADMETKVPCVPDCDTEPGFLMSMIDKEVAQNLELSLAPVLKKEVGEASSQILAPYVMGFLKKELSRCVIQELMAKALSSVIDNATEQKNQDVKGKDESCDSHVSGGDDAPTVSKINSMVQEWKEEMMLVIEKRKVEKEKEMVLVLDRAQKYKERMSLLYCDNLSTRSNCDDNDCDSNYGDNMSYSNDDINLIDGDFNDATPENSTLARIVQDFMQLQNVTGSQVIESPEGVSDQGTQTVSTGCVLYLKCLSDL